MRRAQDLGANAAARAALIGGADFTSNTGISLALGSPPKETHAHSMVQAFMALGTDEREAFEQYAAAYPDDCILLVDTVDTLGSGVPNPGAKAVWRLYARREMATADLICRRQEHPRELDPLELRHPVDTSARRLPRVEISAMENLLTPVLRAGRVLYGCSTSCRISQRFASVETAIGKGWLRACSA